MNIKNLLIGVAGAALAGVGLPASAANLLVDNAVFPDLTVLNYNPAEKRINVESRWAIYDCNIDTPSGNFLVDIQSPGQAPLLRVTDVQYWPDTRTLQLTTAAGATAQCASEVLLLDRFEG